MLQQHYCSLVLIDTWWNVNFPRLIDVFNDKKVLIDTWWNVNIYLDHLYTFQNTVLIDTWWNVNSVLNFPCVKIRFGFNRYMVECKLPCMSFFISSQSCFNRYMVECKSVCQSSNAKRCIVLIDTWWNVNTLVGKIRICRTKF